MDGMDKSDKEIPLLLRKDDQPLANVKLWTKVPWTLFVILLIFCLMPWTMNCRVTYVEMPEMFEENCIYTNIACSNGCSYVFPACNSLDEDELMNEIACCTQTEDNLCTTTNMSVVLDCTNSRWRSKATVKYPHPLYKKKFTVASDSVHHEGFCSRTTYNCAYSWYHDIHGSVVCNQNMIFSETPWTDYFGYSVLVVLFMMRLFAWVRGD